MASMNVYDTDAFNELWNLDFGGYATEALSECASELEAKMKETARSVIDHPGDSEMVDSIKASKPKKSSNGAYIVNVGPRGYSKTQIYYAKNSKGVHTTRKYAVSNALKAIWKEYGISGRQTANPFISRAVVQVQDRIHEALQRKFEESLKL